MLNANELTEWIRQNFFAELSEEEFTTKLDDAKSIYTKIRVYYEEYGLEISLESLSALKEKFLSDTAPTAEEKQKYGLEEEEHEHEEEITLTHINERLKSIQKRALWILIAIIFIIIIK